MNNSIKEAQEKFGKLLEEQLARVEKMNESKEFIKYDVFD